MAASEPIRVLHVVHALDRGGIETWLVHVLRHIDRNRFCLDFVTASARPCAYDDEIRSLGAKITPCPSPIRFWSFGPRFKEVLRRDGPYHIVHSHFNPCGYPLLWARQAGIPVRIAHSHIDSAELGDKPVWVRRLFLPLTGRWLHENATVGLAASRKAAAALFGPEWDAAPGGHRHKPSDCRILYCGIDLSPFTAAVERPGVRRQLGIPADAPVVGHVGRFQEQKNHDFLIEVARESVGRDPDVHFLLIGDGPLRERITRRVAEAGLTHRVILAGTRPDVPRLMLGAMDCFLLPSLYEGLPLVGIEAQAAGLPCVLADTVTEEVDILPPLVARLPLTAPASMWAERVLAAARTRRPCLDALRVVRESPFNIVNGIKRLERLYVDCASACAV
jgi:glycosyltransferase involved in cell wall biosynthesis